MEPTWTFMTGELNYAAAAFLLRMIVAITLLPFGVKKFADRAKLENNFPAVLGLSAKTSFFLAMMAEILAPACLVFGFFTRLAAIGGICNMGVAYYSYIHWPKHKEDPYYYAPSLPILLGYIAVLFVGPGAFSLDYLFF